MTDTQSDTQYWLDRTAPTLMKNYARPPVVMVRGEGCCVWDSDGKRYLDLFAGFGGGILGHCIRSSLPRRRSRRRRSGTLATRFYTEPQIEFAGSIEQARLRRAGIFLPQRRRSERSRLQARPPARPGTAASKRWKIITLIASFHGRTLAMIAATGNPGDSPRV